MKRPLGCDQAFREAVEFTPVDPDGEGRPAIIEASVTRWGALVLTIRNGRQSDAITTTAQDVWNLIDTLTRAIDAMGDGAEFERQWEARFRPKMHEEKESAL